MKKRKKLMKNYKFCPVCKSNLLKTKKRLKSILSCSNCGWIYYQNPLPSVVAFIRNVNDEILLIKRGIPPGKGKWALPSGFIEQGELPQQAVLRELKEETNINGNINKLIGVYTQTTTVYGDVLLIAYDVDFIRGKLRHGSDTRAVKFFPLDKLPKIPFQSHKAIIKDALTKKQHRRGFIEILKSKITKATVTHTQLFYKGSMGIDSRIMKAANLLPGEMVHVLNYNNGNRLITYVIEEKSNSGKMVLYGPASKKGKVGDKLCILAYTLTSPEEARKLKTYTVVLDERNKIKRKHT